MCDASVTGAAVAVARLIPTGARALATVHAARVFCSTVNALVQRRHLMVWAVFAPKFVFDVGRWLAAGAGAWLMNVATHRT